MEPPVVEGALWRRLVLALPGLRGLSRRLERARAVLAAQGDNQAAFALRLAELESELGARRAGSPTEDVPRGSRLCTAEELDEPAYRAWCDALGEPPRAHRKQWELVFVARALAEHGLLAPGRRALGFGVGDEPLPALLASRGVEVLATSLEPREAERRGWGAQTIEGRARLARPAICPPADFEARVAYRAVDMTRIPEDLAGFDAVWSVCALEHLGSLALGRAFVLRSLGCLAPGGLAVHTTELTLSSNERTIDHGATVLYRRRDVEELVRDLAAAGHRVLPVDWSTGTRALDRYVDTPPYRDAPHLRLWIEGHVCTSIGLVVVKGAR